MRYFTNQFEFEQYEYKKNLKKDMNIAGGFLITNHIVMNIVVIILIISMGLIKTTLDDTTLLMLMNGFISIVAFFLSGLIYCKFAKVKIADIIHFDKCKFSFIVPLCLMGLSIAMISNYFSSAVMGLFDMFGVNADASLEYQYNSIYDIIIFYISVAIVPACVEEFAFRGIMLGILRKHSDGLAILVSSIMFGLMHGNFMQIPFAFVVGLILGYMTVKTNSMLPAIIVHFLNNAISVTFSLLTENKNLPIEIVNIIYSIIMIAVAVSGIISFIMLIKKHKGLFVLRKTEKIITYKEQVKIFVTSPTMIIFTILIIYEAILALQVG